MITVRNTSDGQISERIKLNIELNNRQPLIGKLNSTIKGTNTSDADATETDIRYNKTAYVNGKKIQGTLDEAWKLALQASKVEQFVGGYSGPTGIVEYKQEHDLIITKGTQIYMTMPPFLLQGALDIRSEQILSGNTILDVEGTATSDATATAETLIEGETAYVQGEKITGNVKDNGKLNFVPSDEEQEIPKGYTSGGTISKADITTLQDYKICESIADSILTGQEV